MSRDMVAERELLAAMIDSAEARDVAATLVGPDDWLDENAGLASYLMTELDNERVPVELATVVERAATKVGTDLRPFLESVIGQAMRTTAVEALAQQVAIDAQIRRLRVISREIHVESQRPRSTEESREWLLDVAMRVDQATEVRRSRVTIMDAAEAAQHIAVPRMQGETDASAETVSTGFSSIDRSLGGGYRLGQVYSIGGRPGTGKSSFAVGTAIRVAKKPRRPDRPNRRGVAYVSIEMPQEQLAWRILAQLSGVEAGLIRKNQLSYEDRQLVTDAIDVYSRLPIVVDDSSSQNPITMRASVRRMARRLKQRWPQDELGLVVIDHIHRVRVPGDKGEYEEVKAVSDACFRIARDFEVPVIALCQLNRRVESRPKDDRVPLMSDIRGAGAVEEDSFAVGMLHRPDVYTASSEHDGKAQLWWRKVREDGRLGPVDLMFQGETLRFVDDEDRLIDAQEEAYRGIGIEDGTYG